MSNGRNGDKTIIVVEGLKNKKQVQAVQQLFDSVSWLQAILSESFAKKTILESFEEKPVYSKEAVLAKRETIMMIRLAARLAVLSEDQSFIEPALALTDAETLRQMCFQIGARLWEGRGADLALTIIVVQDFVCLADVLSKTMDREMSSVSSLIWALAVTADGVDLDEDGVNTLNQYIYKFPIPQELRLNIFGHSLARAEATPTLEAEQNMALTGAVAI